MPRPEFPLLILRMVAVVVAGLLIAAPLTAEDDDFDDDLPVFTPGLVAEYTGQDSKTYQRIDEQIAMVWRSRSPDPRLPAGPFHTRWKGRLKTWVPGEYRFRLYVAGRVSLKIAGEQILNSQSDQPGWLDSKPVKLEWGHRQLEVTYEKTADDARVKLFWSGPDFDLEPVAAHWLFHEPVDEPQSQFQRGRFLVRALRCAACHDVSGARQRIPAPALDKLTSHISPGWIVNWLTVPPAATIDVADQEMTRRMPHFSFTQHEAAAVAAYLTSFPDQSAVSRKKSKTGNAKKGRTLFRSLGCLACHRAGDLGQSGLFGGGDLTDISGKRPGNYFAKWLTDPESLNKHHRMPVFKLSDAERDNLCAYLSTLKAKEAQSHVRSETRRAPVNDKSLVERGRQLVFSHRCDSCHSLPEKPPKDALPPAPPGLTAHSNWAKSCAGTLDPRTKRPGFGLTQQQQKAITEYLSHPRPTAASDDAAPDGQFLLSERNCLGCHARGTIPGIADRLQQIAEVDASLTKALALMRPPALDSVGDKLHEKTLIAALATDRKPLRPWLMVRMPRFRLSKEESRALAGHLLDSDRIPPDPNRKPDAEKSQLALAGQRLVTSDGFGCTSCHQIGNAKPTHSTQAVHGPDLSMLGRDIRRPWFDRWVHNPARISPRMEMPAVKVPIRGVLDGNLSDQLAALWQVLNQPGFNPPEPNPIRVVRRKNEAQSDEPAVTVTDNIEADGHSFIKPLLVALPNRHNLLFDLERYRLASWRVGDAARQRMRGKYWYWEAGGSPLLPATVGTSELSLATGAHTVQPLIDPSFPPEYDFIEQVPGGLKVSVRLPFSIATAAGQASRQLTVTQTFIAISASDDAEALSGFRRRLEFSGLPKGAAVSFHALPDAKCEVLDGGRMVRFGENAFRVAIITGNRQFESGNGATVIIPAENGDGTAVCEFEYLTSAPVDQFLRPAPQSLAAPQEKLRVFPGAEAVRLPLPEEITPTAFGWRADGRLLFTTLKGRLWQADDTDGDGVEDRLHLLAEGLSAPFGVATHTEPDGREVIDVADKTALLRFYDDDADGHVERVETVASGWGHSKDYHGWVVGLPRDEQGNYYAAVTNRNGPKPHLRGRVLKLSPRKPTPTDLRRYSVEPLAIGLRFSLGIARRSDGELFVSDNQGQYNPFNELNHVIKGAHFGFFNLKGLEDSPELKQQPKTGPAVGIPHPWMRSVNGICFLETPSRVLEAGGKSLYGPFEGDLVGCEATTRKLVRISLNQVGERIEGAAYPLTSDPPRGLSKLLRPLVCRVAPNGDLYVGSVHDSAWGAGRNVGEIVRIRFTESLPAGIDEMRATETGFRIRLTRPVDPERAREKSRYSLSSYHRVPTSAYGGPDQDRRQERITKIEVSTDAKEVMLHLPELRRGFVYELRVRNLTADDAVFHPAQAHYSLGPLR